MNSNEETQEYPEDEEDAEILRHVLGLLNNAGVKAINGIGPVTDGQVSISVKHMDDGTSRLPKAVEVKLPNGKSATVKLLVTQDERPAQLLGGPNPPPFRHAGPVMGGDPIWNDDATQWGTIAFAAPPGSGIKVEGNALEGLVLTCNHVLDFPNCTTASTPGFLSSMKLEWNLVPPDNGKWIDLASARIEGGAPYTSLEVRGLGVIKGVRRSRKHRRVSKYGATTGLTSGLDLGWALRAVTPNDPTLYWVRQVSGYLGDVGDSGAPVMDAERNLVGLVVSGIPGVRNETYLMQASPTPSGPASADRSRFLVSGL